MRKGKLYTSTFIYSLSLSASVCFVLPGSAVEYPGKGIILVAQPKQRAVATPTPKTEMDVEEARKLFEEHQKDLETVKKERETLETETQTLDADRATLQTKLIDAGRDAQSSEKRLTEIEGKLETLTTQEAEIRLALNEGRVTIAQILSVMQSMGREPPPVLVTKRSDALKMVRSAMVLSSFFPKFKAETDRLSTRLADLDRVLDEARTQQGRLTAEQPKFLRLREEVNLLLAEKRERMRNNTSRLEDLKVAASRHTRAVTDLSELLRRLDAEVGARSNLADYEAELKRLGPAIELKPETNKQTIAFVQPGRLKPAIPFEKAKGSLPLPCTGQKIKAFGARDETGGKSEGIMVESRNDAQIIAPSDGWVIYAGQFRSYGQLLIINAGGGYHILLAGMDQIYTSVGQFVLAGEPVAAMGKAAPDTTGTALPRGPALYIEFRKDARPVDPEPWWSQGVKEG